MRKLLAAGLAAAAVAVPAEAGAGGPGDGAVRTDHAGGREFVAGLGLTPPALYPERMPAPFRSGRVLAFDPQAFEETPLQYFVQWHSRRRPRSMLALSRVPCRAIRRGARRLPRDEFRLRETTVRHRDGLWVADDLTTVLAWCEGKLGYGVAFIGPTDDWRLERRKIRAVVRALEPVT